MIEIDIGALTALAILLASFVLGVACGVYFG